MSDTLIAYAAKAGSYSDDGDGANSPFTTALLKHLLEPGVDIRLALGRVRDEVLKNTNNQQEPFVYGSLGGTSISLVPAPSEPKAPLPEEVRASYEMAERINTEAAWEAFLRTFKTGYHVDLARERLRLLQDAAAAAKKKADEEAAAKAQAEARAKARQEEERLAAEQRAREAVEAKRQAEAAAAKKKADEEAAARAQADARAKARQEEERLAAEQRAREAAEPTRVASAPMPTTPTQNRQDPSVLTRAVQTELKRVHCDPGAIDGNWGPKAKDAVAEFARHAKIELKSDYPTEDLLQQLSERKEPVCVPSLQDQTDKGTAKHRFPRSIDVPQQMGRKQASDGVARKIDVPGQAKGKWEPARFAGQRCGNCARRDGTGALLGGR